LLNKSPQNARANRFSKDSIDSSLVEEQVRDHLIRDGLFLFLRMYEFSYFRTLKRVP